MAGISAWGLAEARQIIEGVHGLAVFPYLEMQLDPVRVRISQLADGLPPRHIPSFLDQNACVVDIGGPMGLAVTDDDEFSIPPQPGPHMGGADDIVREMIGLVVQRRMALGVDNRCDASHGERTEARTNSRNGYRNPDWETRAGTVPLRIPKLRSGSHFPPSWSRAAPPCRPWPPWSRKPMCKASRPARWTTMVQAMGMSGITKSQVSRFCAEIDERVQTFLNRPIEGDWPYLWIVGGAMLLEQNDEWALQRRYMTLETLAILGENPNISLPAVAS